MPRVPRKAHGLLAFLDFEFGQVGFFQQVDQRFDLAKVHGGLVCSVGECGWPLSRREETCVAIGQPAQRAFQREKVAVGAEPQITARARSLK